MSRRPTNAVTAAFCCAKLGIVPDPLATVADDWLGRMFMDMAAKYKISIHTQKVRTSSLSFGMPNDGKWAIVRCGDDNFIDASPRLSLSGCRALHMDGHQPDAAMYQAKAARQAAILTSLDGGGLRSKTHELLAFVDIAIVSERLCEQMGFEPAQMFDYLKSRGCNIGGVPLGERGLLWYDEARTVRTVPAFAVPPTRILDTSGAGDVFHDTYVYFYLTDASKGWAEHLHFARAASAYKIQRLGNDAGLPAFADIVAAERELNVGNHSASSARQY